MKKLLVLATLLAFCAPVFAAPKCEGDNCPKPKAPRAEMRAKKGPALNPEVKAELKAKRDEEKAQRKARKAAARANEEKLEKLVKDYKKAKEGSKKQASLRKDIGEVLEQVRQEQISFRAEKLQEFEQRLARMKEGLAKEEAPEAKEAWVNKMTDRVIAEDGDLEEALRGAGRMPKGPFPPAGPAVGPDGEPLPPAPMMEGPDGAPLPPPPAPEAK